MSKKKGRHYPHLQKSGTRNCEKCGNAFRTVRDTYRKKQRWCSRKCWSNRGGSIINKCLYCGDDVKTYRSWNKKYCNRTHRDLHYRERLKGSNSHFWEGGKTKESKIRRTCAEYQEWRMKVFKRDGFKCVLCGSKDEIEADHIKEQSKYPELIYDIKNGRTLCHECHKKTDNYGAKCRWSEIKK